MILDPPIWSCTRCRTERVASPGTSIPMHNCPGLGMLSVPLTLAHNDVRIIERDDYIGNERGIPIVGGVAVMAVETRRPDGSNDVVVFAGTASATITT